MTSPDGEIYLFYAPDLDRFKIGFSENPRDRQKTIQGESPCPVEFVASFLGTRQDEYFLHAVFKRFRVHGEWFAGEAFDVAKAHFDLCARVAHLKIP